MKEGSTGQQVAQLQKFLRDNGTAPTLNIDGNYGPATTAAVKAFQTVSKLVPDGMIGYATRAVILYRYLKATPPASIYNIMSWPDLTVGSVGTPVGQLQQVLNNRSCFPSNVNNDVDKNFGAGTKAAVDNFQKKNSLKEDTIVGPSTRAVLAADDTYSC
jgi:peptidoglycan hydrolase-like protein with peptidoglycan-binding domain